MCGVWWKNSLTVYVCCQSCQDAFSVLLKTKPLIYLSSLALPPTLHTRKWSGITSIIHSYMLECRFGFREVLP